MPSFRDSYAKTFRCLALVALGACGQSADEPAASDTAEETARAESAGPVLCNDAGTDAGPGTDAQVPPSSAATIVPDPSWTCELPQGIPSPEGGELIFEGTLETSGVLNVGKSQYGTRTVYPLTRGSFTGPRVSGTVVNGGIDNALSLPSGAVELESRALLRTRDNVNIYVRSCGVADGSAVRIVPFFEAPANSAYAWLNQGGFVGTRTVEDGKIKLRIVKPVARPGAPTVRVPADATLPQQPWNCPGAQGPRGSTVALRANVGIGGSFAVGATGKGSRNIIPITGGTVTGTNVQGTVLPGGADYQLSQPGQALREMQIEARYVFKTSDGQLINVRNCGIAGGTGVLFETAPDGKYGFLTRGNYQGTIGIGLGSVNITVYE